MKTGRFLTFLGGNNPSFLLFSPVLIRISLFGFCRVRPGFRRGWDILVLVGIFLSGREYSPFLRGFSRLGLFYLRVEAHLSALFFTFLLKTVRNTHCFSAAPAGFNGNEQKVVILAESEETDRK